VNVELLDKAVAEALCPTFQAIVPATSTIAVVAPFLGPKGMAVGLTAVGVGNLAMLGAAATCPEVEIGPDPGPGDHCIQNGCTELSSGVGTLYINTSGGDQVVIYGRLTGYKLTFYRYDEGLDADQYWADVQTSNGGPYVRESIPFTIERGNWLELIGDPGSVCGSSVDCAPTNPPVPDVTYVDSSTNCTYNVKFEGFIREFEGGPISPVYQIEGAAGRASGGRMGGCNFDPVIYTPGPNGPGGPGGPVLPPIPVPPSPPGPVGGVPWWAGPLLAGSTSAALNLIGDALKDALGPRLPEGSFTLEAPCDKDDEGVPLEQTWTFPEQSYEERVITHQIILLEALQTHLNWKTPICSDNAPKPPLEGQWVTTRWESIEKMAHSGRRLRKLFRYRTKSSRDLGQLSAYWADFTWRAGDVCVRHKGAWWGDPQVWAESEDEGKRVIRHAAAEAGLDPDQVGGWAISSSRSPRYGMSGTMRVARFQGFPWVASRDGAAWPNILAK